MRWRPHTERPRPAEVALVAVPCRLSRAAILLPELYAFDTADDRWLGVKDRLLIKHDVFFWMPETDLLEALAPPLPW